MPWFLFLSAINEYFPQGGLDDFTHGISREGFNHVKPLRCLIVGQFLFCPLSKVLTGQRGRFIEYDSSANLFAPSVILDPDNCRFPDGRMLNARCRMDFLLSVVSETRPDCVSVNGAERSWSRPEVH